MSQFKASRMTPLFHRQLISGSVLKVIAMVSMLIDHTMRMCFVHAAWANEVIFSTTRYNIDVRCIIRMTIGRLAFPIFAFLLTEGFRHTRSRRRYALTMLAFALITEPIWDLTHLGVFFSLRTQNVLFTLFIGVCAMMLYEQLRDRPVQRFMTLFALLAASFFMRMDYGTAGVAFILLLYVLPDITTKLLAAACTFAGFKSFALVAFIPIALYNGQRGFICGSLGKYCVYAFYPLHLLVLELIS